MRNTPNDDLIELLAAGENVTRTLVHRVLDSLAETASERSLKWGLTDDAIAHLQTIRDGVTAGADITAALVDFWLSVAPESDRRLLMVHVNEADYAALAEQGEALGVTPSGFATLLAQQSAKERRAALSKVTAKAQRKMLLVASSQQQADQWIMRNAERLTGWSVAVHLPHHDLTNLRGRNVELSVFLDDRYSDEATIGEVRTITRLGAKPCIVRAETGPEDRFSPTDAIRSA